MDINKCVEYARTKHANQYRKQGTPYIDHPLAVMSALKSEGLDENYQIAGLFHDLLEDTDATEEEILTLSNEKVLTAVKLVTKIAGYDHIEYINNILYNDIAKKVKAADRIYNLLDSIHFVKDCKNTQFIENYMFNTRKYYYKNFSSKLDQIYEGVLLILSSHLNDIYEYFIDSSINHSPIWRINKYSKSVDIRKHNKWIPEENSYWWAEINDNILKISASDYLNNLESED